MTWTRWCARRPRPRANARARLERPPPRKQTSMSSRSRKKSPPQRRTRSSPRLPRTPEASSNRWTSRRWSRCSRRGGGWPSSARRRRRRWRHPRRSPIFPRASRETRGRGGGRGELARGGRWENHRRRVPDAAGRAARVVVLGRAGVFKHPGRLFRLRGRRGDPAGAGRNAGAAVRRRRGGPVQGAAGRGGPGGRGRPGPEVEPG